LRFFELMGSALALREKTPLVKNTPTDPNELRGELREYVKKLDVAACLRGYGAALRTIGLPQAGRTGFRYFLLVLDTRADQVTINGYPREAQQVATAAYLAAERAISGRIGSQAVLVSVDSVAALQRAYPNYFADPRALIGAVEGAIR
jgi:hypothetical protein